MTSSGGIPSGSTCVLDTNVLLYAHQNASPAAALVLRRCAAADIIGILPSAVWEELCHRLMVSEAVATGGITGPNPARRRSIAELSVQKRHGLLTNDSVIVACAMRLGADYLITSESGFAAVTGVNVAFLDDVKGATAG